MNDDGLLFGVDDLERLKRGEQPDGRLADRKDVLVARSKAQSALLQKLLTSADPATTRRLNKRL